MTWIPQILHTKRLLLRPVSIADAPALFEYASNPLVSEQTNFERHKSIDDSVVAINNWIKGYIDAFPDPLAIVLPDTDDKMIGIVSCFPRVDRKDALELGFELNPQYWGKGYIVEACRSLINYTFEYYDIEYILGHCIESNKNSVRVMEKLNMTLVKTLEDGVLHKGKTTSLYCFSICRTDFR